MRSLLSTTYFGPVQWYQKLARSEECLIEQYDHFIKQTYRNRCVIATTQGLQALTVPVERYENDATAMRDIRISDHGAWRRLHWNALMSAYNESPYFEFYADDLRPFFEKRWTFLLDFNMEIMAKMCELLDIEPHVSLTDHYITADARQQDDGKPSHEKSGKAGEGSPAGYEKADEDFPKLIDYRDAIRPKHPLEDAAFSPRPYYQVFQLKYGFQPNLSILDLLFNMGNEAVLYL